MIGGKRYLDAAFTPEVLQGLLGPGSDGATFIHIATYFKVEKSLLLLGGGSKLTTGQVLSWTPRLGKYDLIALSACDFGVSEGTVESLGGMLRSKGAKAVLATLWPMADVGAAPLMVEFYRQRGEKRVAGPNHTRRYILPSTGSRRILAVGPIGYVGRRSYANSVIPIVSFSASRLPVVAWR